MSTSSTGLSKDHKPTDPLEKKRIETHGGFVRRSRLDGHLAMSRAFGDFEDKQVHGVSPQQQPLIVTPDLRPLSLEKVSSQEKSSETNEEQFIVVACDGLFESLDGIEVCEFIKKRLPKQHPGMIAKHLAEHAINMDDVIIKLRKIYEKFSKSINYVAKSLNVNISNMLKFTLEQRLRKYLSEDESIVQ